MKRALLPVAMFEDADGREEEGKATYFTLFIASRTGPVPIKVGPELLLPIWVTTT